jgi:hypothetical protein
MQRKDIKMEEQKMYVIASGKNYLCFNNLNEQSTTTDIRKAKVLSTYEKAENVKCHIKKTLKMFDWEIQVIETIQTNEQKMQPYTYRKTIFEDENFNWKDKIQTIALSLFEIVQ